MSCELPSDAYRSAMDIADAVRRRETSPVDTVEAALATMAAVEPRLHAFSTPAPEQARAAAAELEAALARGAPAGPLAGVPVAIKDLVLTKGLRTTFGSRLYADYVPEQDDIVVERLKQAGAVVIGNNKPPEVGFGAVGPKPPCPAPPRPW